MGCYIKCGDVHGFAGLAVQLKTAKILRLNYPLVKYGVSERELMIIDYIHCNHFVVWHRFVQRFLSAVSPRFSTTVDSVVVRCHVDQQSLPPYSHGRAELPDRSRLGQDTDRSTPSRTINTSCSEVILGYVMCDSPSDTSHATLA